MDRPKKNRRPAGKPGSDRRKSNSDKSPRGRKSARGPRREGSERDENGERPQSGGRPGSRPNRPDGRPKREGGERRDDRSRRGGAFKTRPNAWRGGDQKGKHFRKARPKKEGPKEGGDTRLNKYLAHAG
jgi:hypothetical protein